MSGDDVGPTPAPQGAGKPRLRLRTDRTAAPAPAADGGYPTGGAVVHGPDTVVAVATAEIVAALGAAMRAGYCAGYETAVSLPGIRATLTMTDAEIKASAAHMEQVMIQVGLESLATLLGRTPTADEVDQMLGG